MTTEIEIRYVNGNKKIAVDTPIGAYEIGPGSAPLRVLLHGDGRATLRETGIFLNPAPPPKVAYNPSTRPSQTLDQDMSVYDASASAALIASAAADSGSSYSSSYSSSDNSCDSGSNSSSDSGSSSCGSND